MLFSEGNTRKYRRSLNGVTKLQKKLKYRQQNLTRSKPSVSSVLKMKPGDIRGMEYATAGATNWRPTNTVNLPSDTFENKRVKLNGYKHSDLNSEEFITQINKDFDDTYKIQKDFINEMTVNIDFDSIAKIGHAYFKKYLCLNTLKTLRT